MDSLVLLRWRWITSRFHFLVGGWTLGGIWIPCFSLWKEYFVGGGGLPLNFLFHFHVCAMEIYPLLYVY